MPCRPYTSVCAILAGAGLFSVSGSAFATPATETELFDIRDKLVTVNGGATIQSAHVFRGVIQSQETLRLKLSLNADAGPLELKLGATGFLPFQDQFNGIDEPNEIDVYGLARFSLLGLVTEVGVTYYAYPDAEDIGDQSADSLELLAGVQLPLIMPLMVRAYYDVDLQNLTLESEARWQVPLWGDRLRLELSGVFGVVTKGDEQANQEAVLAGARTLVERDTSPLAFNSADLRAYYGVGAALSTRITEHLVLGAHVNWAGTTGEYSFDGRTDDETLWGGITLTAGF